MTTIRNGADMKKSHLIAICAVAIVACGISLAQPPNTPAPEQPRRIPAVTIPGPNPPFDLVPPPARGEVTLAAPAGLPKEEVKPENMSIEQLIEAMEKTQTEITELEKKNQVRLKVLHDKVTKVKERMGAFTGNSQPVFKPDNRVPPAPDIVPQPLPGSP